MTEQQTLVMREFPHLPVGLRTQYFQGVYVSHCGLINFEGRYFFVALYRNKNAQADVPFRAPSCDYLKLLSSGLINEMVTEFRIDPSEVSIPDENTLAAILEQMVVPRR